MLAIETYQYPEIFCSPLDDLFKPVSIFGLQYPESAAIKHLRQRQLQHKKRKLQPSKWYRVYNCAQFKPSEISIKVDGYQLIVTATKVHTNQENGEYESIQYVRKCMVPEQVQVEAMKSYMDDNGMLRLEAPLVQEKELKDSTSSSSSDTEEGMEIEQQHVQPVTTSVPVEVQQSSVPSEEPKGETTPKTIPEVIIEDVGEE